MSQKPVKDDDFWKDAHRQVLTLCEAQEADRHRYLDIEDLTSLPDVGESLRLEFDSVYPEIIFLCYQQDGGERQVQLDHICPDTLRKLCADLASQPLFLTGNKNQSGVVIQRFRERVVISINYYPTRRNFIFALSEGLFEKMVIDLAERSREAMDNLYLQAAA